MARASMRSMAGKVAPVETPTPTVTPDPARPAAAGERLASTPGPALEDARINFTIPRELRQRFKVWAAENDTSIKDELTRHIHSLVD